MSNYDQAETFAKLAARHRQARVEGHYAANARLGLALDFFNPMKTAEFNQPMPADAYSGYAPAQPGAEQPAAAPSLWDQYKTPALLAGGALAAGYGFHHYQKAEEAAQAAKLLEHNKKLEAAKLLETGGPAKLKLDLADQAGGRPPGLLNQPLDRH